MMADPYSSGAPRLSPERRGWALGLPRECGRARGGPAGTGFVRSWTFLPVSAYGFTSFFLIAASYRWALIYLTDAL